MVKSLSVNLLGFVSAEYQVSDRRLLLGKFSSSEVRGLRIVCDHDLVLGIFNCQSNVF